MSYSCQPCNRIFNDQQLLGQHLGSPAHKSEWEKCKRRFKRGLAFEQHLETSPARKPHICEPCKKTFKSEGAFRQHLDSTVHVSKSEDGDRSFGNQSNLKQPLNSPAHPQAYRSEGYDGSSQRASQQNLNSAAYPPKYKPEEPKDRLSCGQQTLNQYLDPSVHILVYKCGESKHRSFGSQQALQQHLSSPAHPLAYADKEYTGQSFSNQQALQPRHSFGVEHRIYECGECTKRSFGSQQALKQHINSPAHLLKRSPLDRFFYSFPSFNYEPSLPPATSFKLLQTQQRWSREDPASKEGWDQYQNALFEEFQRWFGYEDDLEAWHALCRAIRIRPLPITIKACEQAVRHRHVNMIDLIEWGRNEGEGNDDQVKVFKTVQELSHYCRETGKIFRNDLEENSDRGGVVLRHLLRRIFTFK